MLLRSLATAACCTLLPTANLAQWATSRWIDPPQAHTQPPATAKVSLNGKAVTIHYNSPRLKGRDHRHHIVPYGQVWRPEPTPPPPS